MSGWVDRDQNVIVQGPYVEPGDAQALFGPEMVVVVEAAHLPELLTKLGIYKSFSEARRAGRDGPIPPGFTLEMKASKLVNLTIWNPTHFPDPPSTEPPWPAGRTKRATA